MPRTPGWRRCGPRPSGSAPRTPTSGPAAPIRPGSSATSPGTSPSAASPTSTSATRRSCSAASTWRTARRWYVGRIAVEDEEHTPLVVDWRAPVSEPFYRATAVEPMEVVRRRHLISRKGRELVGLDDEVFDQEAIDEAGLPIAGEGALLAALERNRTGRMGDIVATIQAEQDEAIRAEVAGPAGGRRRAGHRQDRGGAAPRRVPPLHVPPPARRAGRAARRPEPGVPALHRARAAVARRARRAAVDDRRAPTQRARPGHRARRDARRSRATRAWRGSSSARSPIASGRSPTTSRFCSTGCSCACARRETARIVEAVQRRRGTHNEQRPQLVQRFIDLLVARYKAAAIRSYQRRADARRPPTSRACSTATTRSTRASPARWCAARRCPKAGSRSSRARCAAGPRCREALERMWPVLSGAELVNDLFGFAALVRSAARRRARPTTNRRLLHRARARDVATVAWTEDDVALDRRSRRPARPGRSGAAREPAARGRRRGARPARHASSTSSGCSGFTDAATLARRNGGAGLERRRVIGRAPHLRPRARRRSPGPHRRCSGACSPAAARRGR